MKKLLIANRGEIARRIHRAAKERGYIVAVISTLEDSDSLICKEVSHVIIVSSFLNAKEIVEQAVRWGAHFIHPGYGFLSENSQFALLVEQAGITFVGPSSENMQAMGNKETAKRMAKKHSVPTLDAFFSEELKAVSFQNWGLELEKRNIISPYLVKASSGGGGRGMRVVETLADLQAAIERSSHEALVSFNDGTVFIERYLEHPRHIEIQVFGDGRGGGIFWGERECSLQRRHQKVIEEAPSACITPEQRLNMGKASLRLVEATKYRGVGTIEYLLDSEGRFYFLEMNTRLQVEHTVTEQAYNIDLVHAQFDLAEGYWPKSFPLPNSNDIFLPTPKFVSLEARVLAEDPKNNFLPTPGVLHFYKEPVCEGIRVDSGVTEGCRINANFDSLIAKVIVTASTRAQAVKKMQHALQNFIILGCTNNITFLHAIVSQSDFLFGKISTDWIQNNLEKFTANMIPEKLCTLLYSKKFREQLSHLLSGRINKTHLTRIYAQQGFLIEKVILSDYAQDDDYELKCIDNEQLFLLSGPSIQNIFKSLDLLEIKNIAVKELFTKSYYEKLQIPFYAMRTSTKEIDINILGEHIKLVCPKHSTHFNEKGKEETEIRSPMAGKVYEVLVTEGDIVSENQILFVIESMKMQLEVKSPKAGKIAKIFVDKGQILSGIEVMAIF